MLRRSAVALCVSLLGCQSRAPAVSVGYANLEDRVELSVYGLAFGARVEICGVAPAKRGGAVHVPFECILSADTPLEAVAQIESEPHEIKVKPLVGAATATTVTAPIDTTKQRHLIEAWLRAVARGARLPRAKKRRGTGMVTPGGGIRPIGARTIGEVDVVVTVAAVDERDTGRECSYTNGMSGALRAWDADLVAYDAHSGAKLGKKRLRNDTPGCPSSNYGKFGERNTVSSGPSEHLMEKWARTRAPAAGDEGQGDGEE